MVISGFLLSVLSSLLISPVVVAAAVVLFPSVAAKLLGKAVDHASEARLVRIRDELARETSLAVERAKADLQATYSTLQMSVDVVAAGQSGMSKETIASVQALWLRVLGFQEVFGSLITLTVILKPDEIAHFIKGKTLGQLESYVSKYRDPLQVAQITKAAVGGDEARLFCGDRLWFLFSTIRFAYMRLSWMMTNSLKTLSYTDWRNDRRYLATMKTAIPDDVVQLAVDNWHVGLPSLVQHLEAAFIHEASRVMSGSKAIADSLADMNAVVLANKAQTNLAGL